MNTSKMSVSEYMLREYDNQLDFSRRDLKSREQLRSLYAANLPQYIPARLKTIADENHGHIFSYGYCTTVISLPWLPDVADQIALELETFGWEKLYEEDRSSRNKHGEPQIQLFYRHPLFRDYDIRIGMDSTRYGSCELVQIGTKEVPVWQVKCE